MTTQEQMNQSVMGTYGRFPVVIDHGAGESCADETGKQYIDFGSGIGVMSLGYTNPEWVKAVSEQAAVLPQDSPVFFETAKAEHKRKKGEVDEDQLLLFQIA